MSKAIYICNRKRVFPGNVQEKLLDVCNKLTPDNIRRKPQHKVFVKDDIAYAISIKNHSTKELNKGLLLGYLYEKNDMNWDQAGQKSPDGNYALFRCSSDEVEVISDIVATRTIWYYHDDEIFIASTSQRAIILYLEAFNFDEGVIPWMLSTGTLGPEKSWDKRIRRLQADTTLKLKKKSWTLSLEQNIVEFSEKNCSSEEHKQNLTNAIRKTIKKVRSADLKDWLLLLSGGYDSRAILCFLKDSVSSLDDLRTVTWGLKKSINQKENDAKIAKDLAHTFQVKHQYFNIDVSKEPIEVVIDRFIRCSEGRTDKLAAYMDGMEIWRTFHDENIQGVVRGDEGFGWSQVASAMNVRESVGLMFCEDYQNLENVITEFNFPTQEVPHEFEKRDSESLAEWRDRLYHIYRIPSILAALSDIKFSYVEQMSPLLSKEIVQVVRTLPDDLRTDKKIFKEIVKEMSSDIPFGDKNATAQPKKLLSNKQMVALLKETINGDAAKDLFSPEFINFIFKGIKSTDDSSGKRHKPLKKVIGFVLPNTLKNWIRTNVKKPKVNGNLLAFRVLIIIKMYDLLKSDTLP